jgi:carboxymethylenebutenolidase
MERKKASDYPQELWHLLENLNHGFITRREFFEKASKYAVGGITVAALLESLQPNYALGQQIPAADSRIKAEYATAPSPQGNGEIRDIWPDRLAPRARYRASLSCMERVA